MENRAKILLLICIYFPNGELMISSQRRSESHKVSSQNQPPKQMNEGGIPPSLGNSPFHYGWRIKNHNARYMARTSKQNQTDDSGLQNTEEEYKGSPFFRKGRLADTNAKGDYDEDIKPDMPEPDGNTGTSENKVPPETKVSPENNRENEGLPVNLGSPELSGFGPEGMDIDSMGKPIVTFQMPEKNNLIPSKALPKNIQIDDKVTSFLCATMIEQGHIPHEHDHTNETHGLDSAYLWVPIRTYIPGFASGVVVEPPVYATGCFNWKLKKCGGKEIWPLMKPCTYWAPVPLTKPQCGYREIPIKYKMVMGRPKEMVPGHCLCDWPCIPYFDPFQKCRVEITDAPDQIGRGGYKVSHNLALQLCRGVAQVHQPNAPIRIPWLPIRITNLYHSEQSMPCSSWEYKPCVLNDTNKDECGLWKKVDGNCESEEVAPKEDTKPEGRTSDMLSRNGGKEVIEKERGSEEETLIGKLPRFLQHAGCTCKWPCLPFFDPINECYDEEGNTLVDDTGENYLPSKNYLESQDRGLMQCTRKDVDITCKVIPLKMDNYDGGDNATTS